jgi:cation transporter-like permease
MPSARVIRILPATLVRALVWLPLILLATALWAAAHAEHPTATDLAIQVMLVLFMAALFVNVVLSVVAILRERHVLDPPEVGRSPFVSEPEQPARSGPQGKAPPSVGSPTGRTPPRQVLSER